MRLHQQGEGAWGHVHTGHQEEKASLFDCLIFVFYRSYLVSLIDIVDTDNYFISASTPAVFLKLKCHNIDTCPDFHILFCQVLFSQVFWSHPKFWTTDPEHP